MFTIENTCNESNISNLIYYIRGKDVMLDTDLAYLYGYSIKDFNKQINKNKKRFTSNMIFQLSKKEFHNIRKKFSLSNLFNNKNLPYAFTEESIYMLPTFLKKETVFKQSALLIKIFKRINM